MKVEKIKKLIDIGWDCYKKKVAGGVLYPENEKMMQLHLAHIFQELSALFEFVETEKIKVILEKPVLINRNPGKRCIDIVILHTVGKEVTYYPVELKCFRELTRDGSGKRRGAQNIGMYDYWSDIENIEQYRTLPNFGFGTHLCLTDDKYYTDTVHSGDQVAVYSTCRARQNVSGTLVHSVANRLGNICLSGTYSMAKWENIGAYNFIIQQTP